MLLADVSESGSTHRAQGPPSRTDTGLPCLSLKHHLISGLLLLTHRYHSKGE